MRFAFVCLASSVLFATCGYAQPTHPNHYQQTYDKAQTRLITPTTSPYVDRGVDIFLSGSAIYWSSRLGDFNVVQSGHSVRDQERFYSPTTDTEVVSKTGQNGNHTSSNDLGFKAKAGIAFEYDGWDSFVEYTWLRPETTDRFSGNTFTSNMDYVLGIPFDHNVKDFKSGKSIWKLHFNSGLWEIGRSFFISPKLILRPHVGLRGVWTKQRFELEQYELEVKRERVLDIFDISDVVITGNYFIYQKQTYWGFGPRAGLNSSWQLSKNFSIVSVVGIAPLWGDFKTKREDYLTSEDLDTLIYAFRFDTDTNKVVKMNFKNHNVNMAFDYQIGLCADAWFDGDNYRIRLQITWELQNLSNFNQFIYINQTKPSDDLTFQGVTAELRFDF